MLTRSTDIDIAALIVGKRREVHFNESFAKEVQLNHALADLLSISNDTVRSSSIDSPSKFTTSNDEHRLISNTNNHIKNTNKMSTSIALLNNLLEILDSTNNDSNKKNQMSNETAQNSQKNDRDHIKPINTFW